MITMIIAALIMFGFLSFFKLPVDMFPDVNFPFVSIKTIYIGAGPEEVEKQITNVIEEQIATISGIENIQSFSMQNVSMVWIKFALDKDPDVANQEVKDKVSAIVAELPGDAEQPAVEKFEIGSEPVVQVVLSGDKDLVSGLDLYDYADNRLKDKFAQVAGVARVEISGGKEREIRVESDSRTLFENNLSISMMGDFIAANNAEISAGYFKNENRETTIKTDAEFQNLDELKNLEIPAGMTTKKIKDLADVKDSYKDVRLKSVYFDNIKKFRNDNVLTFSLLKASDANTVALAEEVIGMIPEISKSLPAGMKLNVLYDNSIFIKASVEDTIENLILGVLLTGLVLFLFLTDLRSTLIVAISMPTSIISTFIVLDAMGFSLNMLSLMGLSTAVGVLVSNSIVVLENIFRFRKMGRKKKDAAREGTAEVTTAVIASTATNLVVFLPIASMTSLAGQFFVEFALTVVFSTVFSLLMSFTLTPMLASIILPLEEKKGWFGRFMDSRFNWFEEKYTHLLKFVLGNKKRPLFFLFLMIVSLIGLFMYMGATGTPGMEFMPAFDSGDIVVRAEMPLGATLEKTASTIKRIEDIVLENELVEQVLTTLGDDKGTHKAKIAVRLRDAKYRNITAAEVNQEFIEKLSEVTDAKINCKPNRDDQEQIQYFLIGPDKDQLESYIPELNAKMRNVKGLINYDTSFRIGKPEITLIPDRKLLSDLGLTAYDLSMTVRNALEGVVPSVYRDRGEEYDIRVCLKDSAVDSPEELAALPVVTANGTYKVSQLAEVKYTEGTTEIQHMDKLPTVEVKGSAAAGITIDKITTQIEDIFESMNFPNEITHKLGGDAEMMEETKMDMGMAFMIAIILTYMLLASILESFFQPLLILSTLPMATIGVFLLMILTGTSMNMFSMMAIIMLIGLVVNDAILILDYTKMLQDKNGMSVKEALIVACPTKMRAVLMTTSAIVLGMLPMALGFGSAGKEMRIPMAMVQIGGMITSTLLTLLLIPSLYYVFTKTKSRSDK